VIASIQVGLMLSMSLLQESVVAPPPRLPLPRPVANAPLAQVNDNRHAAGVLRRDTLTVALDVVEAAFQPDGPGDPLVRILAFAEPGKRPQVPSPMIRAPLGTTVRLTLRNRSDSAIRIGGLRAGMAPEADTVHLAAGATRQLTYKLEHTGNYFYWGVLPRLESFADRLWLDSQLTGAVIVDAPGSGPKPNERVWVITEWFLRPEGVRIFESALVFNGRGWPHNERLTFQQNDSVHFRIINAAAIEHPLHLHGFYFRVTAHGSYGTDSVVPLQQQVLQNMRMIAIGASMSLSFVPSTPGNWVFHCHFATHINDQSSLHGITDAEIRPAAATHAAPAHERAAAHTMRGLVIGMHVTPAPGYQEPNPRERRQIDLLIQKKPNALFGGQPAYGFLVQSGAEVPKRDSITIPGPVLELKRGEPVRILVRNNLDEQSGVHWHGLEIESFPDGVADFSGIGQKIMPPIDPGGSFAAEFTPPRSGTFPYHSHLHELRQIGSGMYGAIIVTDAPRDTTRDHLVVAGGGGLPVFFKQGKNFLLVNGRTAPRALTMTAGDSNRIRIVSIHADVALSFRLGSDSATARWTPIAVDGADLPPALQTERLARVRMGPGETADFLYVPGQPGRMELEVWIDDGQRVVLPIRVKARP
jgi:manganese oxidase